MSPYPSLGVISFTKFMSPEATVASLGSIIPGVATAKEIEAGLEGAGQPGPLWNDLVAYTPPLTNATAPAGNQICVDNELLRAARAKRADRYLLFWVALNLADPRLDTIVREVLTDSSGHLKASAVNATSLNTALTKRNDDSTVELPQGTKATSNILSLLERCEVIKPQKHGGSIIGIERPLPTRHAVPGAVKLIGERLADRGIEALPSREVDLAVSIGANAWLNLSVEEFRTAYQDAALEPHAQSVRTPIPPELVELDTQLRRKGQVVLQGPPGAGKTYVAKEYVRWVTAELPEQSRLQAIIDSLPANERNVIGIADEVERRGLTALWDIVQFHPGYDYTDFVRALAAEPHGEGVTFVPQHRILSLISAVGVRLQNRGRNIEVVLILDEINRGDIPNIFGELLYALEYRGEAVATPYSVDGDASLTIPQNLRVLGTMNTADRSIAVIDYALRRRFVFLDILATDEPIRAFGFDSEDTREAALHLRSATAAALTDAPAGLQVGPSYFLAHADGTDSSLTVLAARYIYEVLPLLSEYEMEGAVDASVIAGLLRTLKLSDGSPQAVHAIELAAYLTAAPWGAADSPPDDNAAVS